MIRRHGVIGGPRQKPPKPKLKCIKVKTEFLGPTEAADEIPVIIVSTQIETPIPIPIQTRELLNPEIDYDSIKDDGPKSIENSIFLKTMRKIYNKKKETL